MTNPRTCVSAALTELATAAGGIERLRGTLRQVLALAEDAPTLTDEQLRARLLALADRSHDLTGAEGSH